MGANLCIEFIVIEETETLDGKKAEMLKRINALTEKNMEQVKAYYQEVMGEDEITLAQAKEHFTDTINETFGLLEKDKRDIAIINHKGDTIYLTGGMTHGGSPTDSYDTFNKFNQISYYF